MGRTLIAALVLVSGMSFANAAVTFRGNAASCGNLASIAMNVTQLRDASVPWGTFEEYFNGALDAALVNPQSYVKSKEDKNYIMGWFKRIYEDASMDAVKAATDLEADCMKVPAKYSV